MQWLKKLLGQIHDDDPGPSEISIRVAEIQARITAFKSSYPWSEEPNKTSKTQSQYVVAQEKQPINNNSKSAEMDALKAKLLGKKK